MATLAWFAGLGLEWQPKGADGIGTRLSRSAPVSAPLPDTITERDPSGRRSRGLGASISSAGAAPAGPEVLNVEVAEGGEDFRCIERVQDGDENAARELVNRLYPTVLRMVRSHLPRRTQEEDLVQAAFVKVFRKLDQFSGRVPLEHWVARISINTCLNQLKHETVRPELRMSDLTEEQEAVVSRLAATRDDLPGDQGSAARELLEKLLGQLSAEDRLVITLLHLEERSTEEISQLTGWSVSWVKVRAFRARHRMRDLWERLFQDETW